VTAVLSDRAFLHGPPSAVWAIIHDPLALQRVLPGAETIEATGPTSFRGVLATRIQFLTVRADVEATLEDADPPRHVVLRLQGRPHGLAGSFLLFVPFDLEAAADPAGSGQGTTATYAVDLTVTGRIASFGVPLLRDTLRRVISTLVANVDTELRGASTGAPEAEPM
jgi:carbon monoxide dehydrogenase subunit G